MSKKRDKRNKAVFNWTFRLTIAVTLILLNVCAIHDQMLMWVESTLFGTWTVFTLVFTYAIAHKWECLREEGYWKGHYTSKEEQWKASILLYVITLMITIGFLIHLIVGIIH